MAFGSAPAELHGQLRHADHGHEPGGHGYGGCDGNQAGRASTTSSADQFTYVGTPSFGLTGPTSGTFTAGQTVTIQWTAANVDAGSSISLAYDTTTNWGNPKWIEVGAVTAANGSASYSWNTTGVAAGTYYLGGYLWDANQAYDSHLVSAITITAIAAPELYAYRLRPRERLPRDRR